MGWCRLRDAGRSFRLDRIQAARVTEEQAPSRTFYEVAPNLADSLRRPDIE
jgi:predicted DNA-binding transcriptional regulator YafY